MGSYLSRGEGKDTPATSAFLSFSEPRSAVLKKHARKFESRCDESMASALKKFNWVLALQVDQRYRERANKTSSRSSGTGPPNSKLRAFVVRFKSRSNAHPTHYDVKLYYIGMRSEDEARIVARYVAGGMGLTGFSIEKAED